jgi:hypothetical protein
MGPKLVFDQIPAPVQEIMDGFSYRIIVGKPKGKPPLERPRQVRGYY